MTAGAISRFLLVKENGKDITTVRSVISTISESKILKRAKDVMKKMRKAVLYIAMSLDGYIADICGGVDWLVGDGTDETNPGTYDEFTQSIDTVIMGYTTYHQIITDLSPEKWVYPGKTSYVLTHKKLVSSDEIVFIDTDIEAFITKLKSEEGKDIWICGGASIINQFVAFDLVDRYCITVIPTLLGHGVRLFASHETGLPLKLISTHSYNGMTDLVYERR